MSKSGRRFAERMADIAIAHSPSLQKAYGGRDALIEQFAGHGEILASVERLLARNEKVLRGLRRAEAHSNALAEKASEVFSRALEVDALALTVADNATYGGSRLVPFNPAPITHVNGNGHG